MSKNLKNGGFDQYGPEHFGRHFLPQSEKVWDLNDQSKKSNLFSERWAQS